MAELDPIEQAIMEQAPEGLFSSEEAEAAPEGLYGEGTHKRVELLEVVTYPVSAHGFGWRIGLKGRIRPNYEYTAKFDLPRTLTANGHDIEEWMEEKETKKLKFLNDALAAFGFNHPVTMAIDTEEQYNAVVSVFRQQIGKVFDMKVVEDGKNVFVDNEDGKATNRAGAKGDWKFEGNGYTKTAWIKKSRAMKA